eukprot:SAG31_NODE_1485_length_8151_cov_6.486215_6_plen_272_part_00
MLADSRDVLRSRGLIFVGKGCYFLVFVQLFEMYGTLIERNTALIEKVSPCRCHKLKAETKSLAWLVTHSELATLNMSHCKALASLASINAQQLHQPPTIATIGKTDKAGGRPRSKSKKPTKAQQAEAAAAAAAAAAAKEGSSLGSRASLTSIDLSDCEKLANIADLATCSSLKELNLAWSASLDDCGPLGSCAQLTALNLSCCGKVTQQTYCLLIVSITGRSFVIFAAFALLCSPRTVKRAQLTFLPCMCFLRCFILRLAAVRHRSVGTVL